MSQSSERLRELFAEGVEYTLRERWVSSTDVQDPVLRALLLKAEEALDDFKQACQAADNIIWGED